MIKLKGSWRTSAAGIIGGLLLILSELQKLVDANPDTNLNVETIIAGVGLMSVGFLARDNKVSSEEVGAAPKKEDNP